MKLEIGLELISFLCLRKGAKTPGIRSENRTVINKKQVHLAMLDENLFLNYSWRFLATSMLPAPARASPAAISPVLTVSPVEGRPCFLPSFDCLPEG